MKDMICLTELLKVPGLSGLKVVAGHNGLMREISTVTLLDAPDGPKWLKGGEFVLTSAYIFDNNYELLVEYILALIEKNASGLGIKTGRFLNLIPDSVVKIATSNKFPIVEIPYHLVWTDVISPFYKLKFGSHNQEKPVVVEPDMILPLFEASRWGGKRLLIQMTELFQIPIAVYKQNKSLILNNGIFGVNQIEQAAERLLIFPEIRSSEKIQVDDFICCFFCLPMSYENEREYLAVASEKEDDIKEIKKLLSLIESLSSKDILVLKEKSDAYRAFLHKVVGGSVTPKEVEAFEESRMGTKSNLIYSGILIFSSESYQQMYLRFKETLEFYQKGRGFRIETYMYENHARKQAVVLCEIHSSEKRNPHIWVRRLISDLHMLFPEATDERVGISSMAETLKDIAGLYEQAQQSIRLGALLWPAQHFHFYPDYSIFALLNQSSLEQVSFDDCLLLLENKSTMVFQPLEMAEVYIESGNYKKAAAKLFIHENTLRYRINKINELLHINLENPVEGYRLLSQIKLWRISMACEKEKGL